MIAGLADFAWLYVIGGGILIYFIVTRLRRKRCFVCNRHIMPRQNRLRMNRTWAHLDCWKAAKWDTEGVEPTDGR